MTTIRDIAKLADVSVTTVSKVINNYSDISEETRQKVIQVMKKENYEPNAIARSLSTSKSFSIGLFFNYNFTRGLHQDFFHSILFGFETNLGEKGYDFLYFSDFQRKKTCDYVAKCQHRHIDGALLMGIPLSDKHIDELLKSDIPSVFIDVDLVSKNATYLTCDNVGGAETAINHLYNIGHRKIGMITGLQYTKPTQDRMRGYQQAVHNLQIPYRTEWIVNTEYSEVGGYKAMHQLLALMERPTAIFCHSDSIAIGAIKAIRDAGLNVPDDFSIVGFDDLMISSYIKPKLTTVRQDTYLMGSKAADLLSELINYSEKSISPIVLPTRLVERESTKKYKNCKKIKDY